MARTTVTETMKALRMEFWSPYEQHADRRGQRFALLGMVDPNSYDADECGEMFVVRFDDGSVIEAWPEEVFEGLTNVER